MDLYSIDDAAVHGDSWLHHLAAAVKLLMLAAILALLLATPPWPVAAAVFATLLLCALTARVPWRLWFGLTLYPLVFLVIIFLSITGLHGQAALLLALRVFAITAAVVTVLLTTSYPAIFAALGRVLPSFIVAGLFFTYRAIFIIGDSISNTATALHLRGGWQRRRPLAALRHLGMALGHVIIDALAASERMADGLQVRGFANRLYTLRQHRD